MSKKTPKQPSSPKQSDLEKDTRTPGEHLTTNQGLRVADDQNSLKAGIRGPSLLEDFHLREKITHFDHERIPERVVHARGAAAHGYFQVYEPLSRYTKAQVFQDPKKKTPVFVRFSTVAGSRGSADTPRDVRGFAVKFYTDQGVWDLVGNNIPVFFIQDAIKFPDFIHAVKPEPDNEIPQAASAHDTFWDFVSLTPESAHMLMWVMSDRAFPRSLATMEGFGVHTFRLINAEGKSCFVKFHWKPLKGIHSLIWEEAQQIAGKDPDFNRRDLWESIERGDYPTWELGMQIIDEKDEYAFDFDLLDPTKLVPEELVPVQKVGRLVLDRNPDNFFAETEQVAFHPGHIVPGIDFTNDPLLQGRLFSYLDTQLKRIGPNFHELPINRPTCPVHNHQRDAMSRQTIDKGKVAYFPNSLGGGCPAHSPDAMAAFSSHQEKMDGAKVRQRSPSFGDHYSQATLFWNSMAAWEKAHIVNAFAFELNMVKSQEVRQRALNQLLLPVSPDLAQKVGQKIGLAPQASDIPPSQPARSKKRTVTSSPALSMDRPADSIRGRKVALLVCDGVSEADLTAAQNHLQAQEAIVEVVAPHAGSVKSREGHAVAVDKPLANTGAFNYDAILILAGEENISTLTRLEPATRMVNEAFIHSKTIGATAAAAAIFVSARIQADTAGIQPQDTGLIVQSKPGMKHFLADFVHAMKQHRHFKRQAEYVPG